MNTFTKISSNEGGVFTADNNLVSFDIPEGQYYNLSSGYLNLVCSVPVLQDLERNSNNAGSSPFSNTGGNVDAPGTALGGNGVYIPKITTFRDGYSVEDDNLVPNEAIVKNISMTSQNAGTIEEIKRNDILRTNLKYYTSYRDEAENSNYESLFNGRYGGQPPTSLFTDINREGTVASRNLLRQPVRIPLKNMLNFCKVQQYNTNKYGRTKLRLELDIQRIKATTLVFDNAANGQLDNGRAPRNPVGAVGSDLGSQNMFRCIDLTSAIGPDMKSLMLSADASSTTQVIPRRINREEDIPFYVGQKINIAAIYAFNAGANPAEKSRGMATGNVKLVTRRIIEIKYNRGESDVGIVGALNIPNSVTLVLNEPIDTSADSGTPLETGSSYKGIQIRSAQATLGAFQVDFAEVVLEQLAPQNVQPDNGQPIQYTTFETEEFTSPAQNSFQRMFECPPNCSNLYVMRPENAADGVGCLTSEQGNITQYRIRVDNKDVSDRAISLRSNTVIGESSDPLHLQKMSIALQNSNLPVKNLTERGLNTDLNSAWSVNNHDRNKFLIGQVLPITNSPKHVQLNIDSSSAGPQRLALFKEVIKQI